MNVQQLLARHEAGSLSTHEFVVSCLTQLDPLDPSATLRALPAETLPWLRDFPDITGPGEMRSTHGGPIPTPDQIRAARQWISRRDSHAGPMNGDAPGTPTEAARTAGP
jgi:hypothetical protein